MTDQTPNDGWPPAQGQPPVPPASPDGAPAPSQPNPMPPTQPYGEQPQQHGQQPEQYGQQPDPYGAGPGGPGGPMYPSGPGGPTGPGGPVPPKKGLPGWAIGLIIAGGLLLIGVIVVAVLVASLIVNAVKEEDCSASGSCGQGLPPTASEEPLADSETEQTPADPEADPGSPGTSSGNISMDSSAEFDAPPIWSAPLLEGWEIVILDQDGINQFANTELDCSITTSQNVAPVDLSPSSDLALTMQLMDELGDQLASATTTAKVVSERAIDLSLGSAGSGSHIEFAMNRIDYSTDTGDYASVLFGRSMPHSGSYMWSQLSCARTVMDGADSPLQVMMDQITVLPAF